MNKDKVQNQNILGTLVNKDESGIIAYSDQIYDKKADKSLEEENTKQNERLDNAEAKDRELQSTLENITKTGEASAASNVTYNHNDSKLDATNVQQAVDEVRKRSNYNDGDNIIDFNTIHIITDNPEFVNVETDSDGKLIESTDTKGNKTVYGNLNVKGAIYSSSLSDAIKNKVDKEEGKVLIDKNIADTLEEKESPEYIAVNVDAANKVLDSVDSYGNVTHNTKHIFKGGLEANASEFAKALKEGGYLFSATDWSSYISNDGNNPLHLPEPKCAFVNIEAAKLPTSKKDNIIAKVQYWDKIGNYFEKNAIINAQGNSTLAQPQKNIAVDFFDENVYDSKGNIGKGDSFSIKIGNWIPQDSYHLKCFYFDPMRGLADVCYKFAEKVITYTDTRPNRLAKKNNQLTVNGDSGIIKNDYETGALCHPDGFPIILYFNGEFYGIYTWNLKKNRDNYMMDKKDYESIIIDSDTINLWSADKLDWTQFEIRNPKTLICMDGSKYDGDTPKELIDTTSSVYVSTDKNMVNTVKTKELIIKLHGLVPSINNASTTEEKKEIFEKNFDIDAFIIFWILSQVLDNYDGLWGRNTNWIYYKESNKWCPTLYDLDSCLGYHTLEPWLFSPNTSILHTETTLPYGLLWSLYKEEIVTKYKELRDSGVLSTDSFMSILYDWCNSIGFDYLKKNIEMWDIPCYRDGKVNNKYWKQIGTAYKTADYDSSKTYKVGEVVGFGQASSYCILYQALAENVGQEPAGKYDKFPAYGGTFDSPRRVELWLNEKFNILDKLITV